VVAGLQNYMPLPTQSICHQSHTVPYGATVLRPYRYSGTDFCDKLSPENPKAHYPLYPMDIT